jgi:hypothetical protein
LEGGIMGGYAIYMSLTLTFCIKHAQSATDKQVLDVFVYFK